MVFADYKKYGDKINTHDVIKVMAITLMVIDHIGKYFYPDIMEFRLIGRMAFPLFLFLVGWSLQYKLRKDLLFYAAILTAINVVTHQPLFSLNVLFTILFVRAAITWLDKGKYIQKHLFVIFLLLAIWHFPVRLFFDYGTTAIMFALCGYLVRKKAEGKRVVIFFVLTAIFHVVTQSFLFRFPPIEIAMLAPALAILAWGMFNYKFERFESSKKSVVLIPLMFISRNSLQLYFLHLAIIKIVLFLMYPEQYENFRLI